MIQNTGTTASYSNYCGNRLPCGICRLMMSVCPIGGQPTVVPTWEITCNPNAMTTVSALNFGEPVTVNEVEDESHKI